MSSFASLRASDFNLGRATPVQRARLYVSDDVEDYVEFDASVSEVHTGDAVITDHPVEGGSDISDHVRRKPEALQLSIIVSSSPIAKKEDIRPSTANGSPDSRVDDAYRFIIRHKNAGTLMGAFTTLRNYDNMIITSTSVMRDKDTGNILSMNLGIREIIIATTEIVDAPAPDPVNPSRRRETDLGRKEKPGASAGVASDSESKLFEWTFGG